jgi:osmotically-inducible protein OsmY
MILASICYGLNGCTAVAVGGVAALAATGAAVGTDPRANDKLLQDNQIQAALATQFANNDNYNSSNIYLDVYNGAALITGQIKTTDLREEAAMIVGAYPGITKVYNYLEVRLPTSTKSRATDSLITTQLKAQLLAAKGINSNNIKVETTNAVVYMMGIVPVQQAQMAAKIAATVGGVKRVVTLFN